MNQRLLTLVDQILAAKQRHTPQSPLDRGEGTANTTALEKQIDEMVYKLYDLTCLRACLPCQRHRQATHRQAPEEIEIVEGGEPNVKVKKEFIYN